MNTFDLPLSLYASARNKGLKPMLLDAPLLGSHLSKQAILGVAPVKTLEVREGILFVNGKRDGTALDIFSHLNVGRNPGNFFPAWMGYFTYEFARHFGMPTKNPDPNIPEAFFHLYEDGHIWPNTNSPEHSQLDFPAILRTSLTSNFSRQDFLQAVREVQELIKQGIVYQVNLSQQFSFDVSGIGALNLYYWLRHNNPGPFMGLIEHDDWAVLSGSPERLFQLHDTNISARPIAGTNKRGATPEQDQELEHQLLKSPKERAEHAMLVDLLRNDIAKVAVPGSVELPEIFSTERYAHVMHLVSQVTGKTNATLQEVMRAVFPGGTITGAPKETVMQSIAELEPCARGTYTGSMGYISSGQGTDFNILIRSMYICGQRGYFSAGAGIVIDSIAEREYDEITHKARSIQNILGHGPQGQSPLAPNIGLSLKTTITPQFTNKHVLFLENHDSFSYNIVHAFESMGAQVTVVDHKTRPFLNDATHIVLGPGPGNPQTSGYLLEWVHFALQQKIPTLGVCLGHQAIGVALGADLVQAVRPIHGTAHDIYHAKQRLFSGINTPSPFTRYHSLVLKNIPDGIYVDAWTNDDCVMGISHPTLPIFGVQFHPESFLSTDGMQIFANFLGSQL